MPEQGSPTEAFVSEKAPELSPDSLLRVIVIIETKPDGVTMVDPVICTRKDDTSERTRDLVAKLSPIVRERAVELAGVIAGAVSGDEVVRFDLPPRGATSTTKPDRHGGRA
jgi:hypothetical protein